MMLRYSFDMPKEADEIENAVGKVLSEGYRTADIMSAEEGLKPAKCSEMGDLICRAIKN